MCFFKGAKSSAALELLPLLITGPMRSILNSRRFFFDVYEVGYCSY